MSKKQIAFYIFIGAVLFGLLCWQMSRPHPFRVTFLDIGQGDAGLIEFGNGQTMLVDCGPDRKVLSRLGSVLPWFTRRIDYVVATHPDLDHYGGCIDVVRRYRVGTILVNGDSKPDDPFWRTWDNVIHMSDANVVTVDGRTTSTIADATLVFLSPDKTLALDPADQTSNNGSIVFRLTHATSTFLFTGDMERPLEHALLARYCSSTPIQCPELSATVLKVGHHGSGGSSSAEFLTAVAPQVGVISVGRNNHYHHPSLRVVRALERIGARILRTDELGNVLWQ